MSRFMQNKELLQQHLKTHPYMADLPSNRSPETVKGDHKSVVLYAGIRTYCWRTELEQKRFMKHYRAKHRREI